MGSMRVFMAGDEIMLRPYVQSEAEVVDAQRRADRILKGLIWPILFGFASASSGVYFIAASGDWTKGLFPLLLGLEIVAGLSFVAFRLRHIRHVETRFAITDKGLRVENVLNGWPTRSVIEWRQVASVEQAENAVLLRLLGGERQRIPASCFESEEQRAAVLRHLQASS